MRKNFLVLFAALFAFTGLRAQTQNPVTWMAAYKATGANEGEIVISASIAKDWHTYSQRPTDDGPVPTSFAFTKSAQYELLGKTEESEAHEEFVKAFEAKIFVFTGKAEFRQKIRHQGKGPLTVSFQVEYMCCNDMMCLPPKTVDLSVKVQ